MYSIIAAVRAVRIFIMYTLFIYLSPANVRWLHCKNQKSFSSITNLCANESRLPGNNRFSYIFNSDLHTTRRNNNINLPKIWRRTSTSALGILFFLFSRPLFAQETRRGNKLSRERREMSDSTGITCELFNVRVCAATRGAYTSVYGLTRFRVIGGGEGWYNKFGVVWLGKALFLCFFAYHAPHAGNATVRTETKQKRRSKRGVMTRSPFLWFSVICVRFIRKRNYVECAANRFFRLWLGGYRGWGGDGATRLIQGHFVEH